MESIRALFRHPLAGPMIRYGMAGSTVAAVYLAVPLILNGGLNVPIEVAIPIGYLLAITLHFNLQRHFVFRHVDEFALSARQQIGRYALIGSVQYPTTALATALLPGWLGLSERVTFVMITLIMSLTFFLILRGHVFHPDVGEELLAETIAERRTVEDPLVAEGTPGRPAEPDQVAP